jgi:hypothetical protein
MGSVRGEAIQDDIVFEAKLQGFEGLMRPETVTNQYPGFSDYIPRDLESLFTTFALRNTLITLNHSAYYNISYL